MKYLILFFSLCLYSCGSGSDESTDDTSDEENSNTEVLTDCPENKINLCAGKDDSIIAPFEFKHAFGNYNKSWGTTRIILIDYPMEEYGEFDRPPEGFKKLVIAVYTKDQSPITARKYTTSMNNPENNFIMSVQVETSTSMGGMTMYGGEGDPGFVEVLGINDASICGTVQVKDDAGMNVEGSFNVDFIEL